MARLSWAGKGVIAALALAFIVVAWTLASKLPAAAQAPLATGRAMLDPRLDALERFYENATSGPPEVYTRDDYLMERNPLIVNSRFSDPYYLADDGKTRVHWNASINDRGYRSDGVANASFRVLVVGDSMTFGWGVNDSFTYPARLEELLGDADVINMGVQGDNLVQKLGRLQEGMAYYRPDVVIFQYYEDDYTVYRQREYVKQLIASASARLGAGFETDAAARPIHDMYLKRIDERFRETMASTYRAVREQGFDDLDGMVGDARVIILGLRPSDQDEAFLTDQCARRGWSCLMVSDEFFGDSRIVLSSYERHYSEQANDKIARALVPLVRNGSL